METTLRLNAVAQTIAGRRNTVSLPAPLRAVYPLTTPTSLNLRTRAAHSDSADCPSERSSSSSGCPTVLASRAQEKFLPAVELRPGLESFLNRMYVLLRAKRASIGRARMGLMDFEAQGSQGPQAILDVCRGHLTTKQRRKEQTLILARPTTKTID